MKVAICSTRALLDSERPYYTSTHANERQRVRSWSRRRSSIIIRDRRMSALLSNQM